MPLASQLGVEVLKPAQVAGGHDEVEPLLVGDLVGGDRLPVGADHVEEGEVVGLARPFSVGGHRAQAVAVLGDLQPARHLRGGFRAPSPRGRAPRLGRGSRLGRVVGVAARGVVVLGRADRVGPAEDDGEAGGEDAQLRERVHAGPTKV